MSLFGKKQTFDETTNLGNDDESSTLDESLSTMASHYIEENTGLYRHYAISQVQRIVEQGTGVSLSKDDATRLVQNARDSHHMGPIADYNRR
jgi:hypothetical protein